jgi:hypothetical protein
MLYDQVQEKISLAKLGPTDHINSTSEVDNTSLEEIKNIHVHIPMQVGPNRNMY